MNNVILQPTGKGEFQYNSTMRNGIDLNKIKPFLNLKDFECLSDIYKSGKVHIWGITAGQGNCNVKKWRKIQSGDIVLFYGDKVFFSSAIVTYKIHNSILATELWGDKKKGETWEYIYFVEEIKNQLIEMSSVNTLLGYSANNYVFGVMVLDQDKSNKMMNAFDFFTPTYIPAEQAKKELETVIDELEQNDSLEREVKRRARKEQNIIRGYLFGTKKTCSCGICGEEYPVDLLVAAHIKKRAHCSRQEKLDIKHIAIPMCKFGCDDLFEKGYIGVQNGEVISLVAAEYLPKSVKDYIENIQGKACDSWNVDNDKYFEWHTNYHTHRCE